MWLILGILAYFINAINALIDKSLLKTSIPHPLVYGFYVGILSLLNIIFLPLDFQIPNTPELLFNFFIGIIFILALITFYYALKQGEPSIVTTIIGGLTPVIIGTLSFLFLEETLTRQEFIAFTLFVTGGVLLSFRKTSVERITKIYPALLAALLFGIFYTATKFAFQDQSFISTFVWMRMGSVIAAIFLVLTPYSRKLIFHTSSNLNLNKSSLFLINKLLAGIAFVILNYAIYLASVTLVQSLQGIQYIFILMITSFLAKKFPEISEENEPALIIQKILAIIFISTGFILLAR